MCSSSPARTPKCNLPLNHRCQKNVGTHQKKDTPQPRAKEKLQQDSRRGSTAFKSKRHAHQRHVEGTHQDPGKGAESPPETGPGMPVSVCGSPVETWVSRGLPRGRGSGSSRPERRSMWHKTATIPELPAWATHKLENNYTQEVLTLLGKFWAPQQTCPPGKGTENPRESDLEGQRDLITELNFYLSVSCQSVQFSRSVVSDSLRPHEPQHAGPPCPSPTPGVYSNPCPLSR